MGGLPSRLARCYFITITTVRGDRLRTASLEIFSVVSCSPELRTPLSRWLPSSALSLSCSFLAFAPYSDLANTTSIQAIAQTKREVASDRLTTLAQPKQKSIAAVTK